MKAITTESTNHRFKIMMIIIAIGGSQKKRYFFAVSIFINQLIQTTKSTKKQKEYKTTIHINNKKVSRINLGVEILLYPQGKIQSRS